MASPQAENGHIDIANEVAEALCRTNLSAYQSRILWALLRKTWGWHKKEDWISLSQFEEATGVSKSHVSRTITELKSRNIITNSGNKISFNKDYTQWRALPIGARGYQSGQRALPIGAIEVTNPGNKGYQSGVPQKKLSKETLTKETSQKKVPTAKTFSKPTLPELTAYCQERNNNVDPELWLAHYESNGWMVGRNPMRDWKAAVRTWEKNARFAGNGNRKHDGIAEWLHKQGGENASVGL